MEWEFWFAICGYCVIFRGQESMAVIASEFCELEVDSDCEVLCNLKQLNEIFYSKRRLKCKSNLARSSSVTRAVKVTRNLESDFHVEARKRDQAERPLDLQRRQNSLKSVKP
ncbi:hypothetical protein AVEN_145854-1 [Araneus ventricosus]|uniref:Uncharacterized protein n=1 Tax=Araneus ventricosus TaxID=182803 RepID=A0A4Y2UXJ1_ARAVE|nr:hypothetical protein AVEN_145854-1 [Araneus ventricosus]